MIRRGVQRYLRPSAGLSWLGRESGIKPWWDADPNPGETTSGKTTYNPAKCPAGCEGQNVSGFNTIEGHDYASCLTHDCSKMTPGFAEQGGWLSRLINGTPGGAAISHLDDLFNNIVPSSLGDSLWFKGFTIPTAMLITAPALMPTALPAALNVRQTY